MATETRPKARTRAGKISAPGGAKANAVSEIRRKLGLSRKLFSRLTGYSERAIANWESSSTPDAPGLRRIREWERFQEKLAEVMPAAEIPRWLDTPNDAFDKLKPIEIIERGEIDRLWTMIFYLESGVAS